MFHLFSLTECQVYTGHHTLDSGNVQSMTFLRSLPHILGRTYYRCLPLSLYMQCLLKKDRFDTSKKLFKRLIEFASLLLVMGIWQLILLI